MRRDPSLGRMALLSIALHAVIVIIFSLTAFFKSQRYISPSPYTVRLVAPEARKKRRPAPKPQAPKKPAPKPDQKKKKPVPKMPALKPDRKPEPRTEEKEETVPNNTEQLVSDEIERLRRIRELSEKARDEGDDTGVSGGPVPEEVAAGYHGIVRLLVHERWVFSGRVSEYLEAEVLISIGRQGGVTNQKIVKSSGNSDFDRSVMRAIAKASPFPAPPEGVDTEIQFRFRPGDIDNF